jgi:broad specificity phosphatase PhoE
MRLYLIRHGQSSANAEGRLQGRLDFGLSERGRGQSEALAVRLANEGIHALYSSPLRRARETAEIVSGTLGLSIINREELIERDVGHLAGLTRAEIVERFPEYVRARAEVRDVDVPGFETDASLAQRVERVFDEIIGAHEGQNVAVVSHGGVISAFLRHTLHMPVVRPGPFAVDNAAITTFMVHSDERDAVRQARVQLLALNDTCHLDGLAS